MLTNFQLPMTGPMDAELEFNITDVHVGRDNGTSNPRSEIPG